MTTDTVDHHDLERILRRLEAAEAVVQLARDAVSPTEELNTVALVYAIGAHTACVAEDSGVLAGMREQAGMQP